MKARLAMTPVVLIFCGCAATMSAQQMADYNGDGMISDAEMKQYNKQATVQERTVQTESIKRQGAVGTVRDTNEVIWTARSILSGIRSF